MNSSAMQVLLVEDNPADASVLRRLFARLGQDAWKLVEVPQLDEAIEACQEHVELMAGKPFDVVLLDLSLPDTAGIETVRRFCQTTPNVPVVILTGTEDEALAVQAIQSGAQDYLVKDHTSIHQLVRTIRLAIARNALLKKMKALTESKACDCP
jgi:CheY-like chemotaxis protein